MKRTIYIARSERDGDEFDNLVTFDRDDAISEMWYNWNHLTDAEKKKARDYVAAYKCIDSDDGESATEAYIRWLDELTNETEWGFDIVAEAN